MPSRSPNHRNTYRAKLTLADVDAIRELAASLPSSKVAKAQYIQDALELYQVGIGSIEDVIAGRTFASAPPAFALRAPTTEAPMGPERIFKL